MIILFFWHRSDAENSNEMIRVHEQWLVTIEDSKTLLTQLKLHQELNAQLHEELKRVSLRAASRPTHDCSTGSETTTQR
jgi:hypothetical protein